MSHPKTTRVRAVVLNAEKHWECPSCGAQYVTQEPKPHIPMHPCPKLALILAPYVEVTGAELDKHKQRHVVVEREDYIGNELVRVNAAGRPIRSIITERADGSNDNHVFAPTARAGRDDFR